MASWRVAKAERFLAAARDAFEGGYWESVASRAYYASYHLVACVLEEKAGVFRQPWRSEQLQRDFRERFTNRGYIFVARDAETFRSLWDERVAADYSSTSYTQRRAERTLRDTEKLCSRLKEVVRNG